MIVTAKSEKNSEYKYLSDIVEKVHLDYHQVLDRLYDLNLFWTCCNKYRPNLEQFGSWFAPERFTEDNSRLVFTPYGYNKVCEYIMSHI